MRRKSPSKPRSIQCVLAAGILPVVAGLLIIGCQSGPSGFSPGLSGMRTEMKVIDSRRLGPYLTAQLEMGGKVLDAYVIPSDACRVVFAAGESIVYVDNGPQGVYRRGDSDCQAMGVSHLVIWRNRSRHSAGDILPRSQVFFQAIHRGDEYALLRGQFPGAARIGFRGDRDLVAVIPVGGACAAILERRTASMEYRAKGSRVFSLVGQKGLCEIHGFAQPPPQIPASDTPAAGPRISSEIEPTE